MPWGCDAPGAAEGPALSRLLSWALCYCFRGIDCCSPGGCVLPYLFICDSRRH